MAVHDFRSQRLFVDTPLATDTHYECTKEQSNYLRNVLRIGAGGEILVFNGHDGEWRATLELRGKRGCALAIIEPVRGQMDGPDLHYLFAPLKRARLDYMVQKATEMGVAQLQPIWTEHTNVTRVNGDRMRANVVEAAEQCGVLRLPEVHEPRILASIVAEWPQDRTLFFADEAADIASPLAAFDGLTKGAPVAVIIGPEGGFAEHERRALSAMPQIRALSLGPRIMRADTAAVALLALVNAIVGDWSP